MIALRRSLSRLLDTMLVVKSGPTGQRHHDDHLSILAALEGEGKFTAVVDTVHATECVHDPKNETSRPRSSLAPNAWREARCAAVLQRDAKLHQQHLLWGPLVELTTASAECGFSAEVSFGTAA
jgi:hypothetical protein